MTPARFVLIPKAAKLTGYSRRAIELKIARGQWREGIEWREAPVGHRMIDLPVVERWVLLGRA